MMPHVLVGGRTLYIPLLFLPVRKSTSLPTQCGVIAPQLVGKPVVGSLRKTHLWDLDKKLIKRFFDSY